MRCGSRLRIVLQGPTWPPPFPGPAGITSPTGMSKRRRKRVHSTGFSRRRRLAQENKRQRRLHPAGKLVNFMRACWSAVVLSGPDSGRPALERTRLVLARERADLHRPRSPAASLGRLSLVPLLGSPATSGGGAFCLDRRFGGWRCALRGHGPLPIGRALGSCQLGSSCHPLLLGRGHLGYWSHRRF